MMVAKKVRFTCLMGPFYNARELSTRAGRAADGDDPAEVDLAAEVERRAVGAEDLCQGLPAEPW